MSHDLNFLQQSEPLPVRKKRNHGKLFFKLVAVFIFLVFGYLIVAGLFAGQVAARALDGKESVEQAEDALYELRLNEAQASLLSAQDDFQAAANGMKWLVPLEYIPWLGDQVYATRVILDSGQTTAGAMSGLLEVAGDVIDLAVNAEGLLDDLSLGEQVSWSELPAEVKETILIRLADSASDLELARLEIDLILRDLQELPSGELVWPLQEVLRPFTEQLQIIDSTLEAIIPVAFVMPSFAGLEREQNVLLLFLNNTEMRPGGGFIGSYGIVTFKDAELINLETHGVMNIDRPASEFHQAVPPEPIQNYLTNDVWFFRDSNWSPDFAVSTLQGLDLFYQETAGAPEDVVLSQQYQTFDAVVGLTPTFVSDLMALAGPIELDGQVFNSENITDTLEYAVEYGFQENGIPFEQRKEIIGELAAILKDRLFDLSASEWGNVFTAIGQALTNKQLVIYSSDQAVHQVIADKDWAGRVFPGEVDTLMVVDANMASLKTDPAVERTINYSITPDLEGNYRAQVDIVYDHQGSFDWKTSRYRTYTRIYVPKGSQLISHDGSLANDKLKNPDLNPGAVDQTEELDLTVFGMFTSIEPGEARTISFEYQLPESVTKAIDNDLYQLELIKQIGAADHNLNLEFDFDKNIKAAYPGEEPDQFGDDRYRLSTKLDQDVQVTIEL